jgi:dolichol-phosphate mannosyltransferase
MGARRERRQLAAHLKLISRAGTTYARLALGVELRDVTGGFRAFRRSTLEGIDLDGVHSQGYCFQIDLAWRTVNHGLKVVEVPITFVERELGVSKMSSSIVAEAIWRVTLWGLAKRFGALHRGRAERSAVVEDRPTVPTA